MIKKINKLLDRLEKVLTMEAEWKDFEKVFNRTQDFNKSFKNMNMGGLSRITINGKTFQARGNNVTMVNGKVFVDGKPVNNETYQGEVRIKWEGDLASLKTDYASVECGDVKGNVDAGGSVVAKNVGGDVDCGGSVQCHDIGKNVDCGGSVNASLIQGDVDAGGSVRHG